MQELHLSGQKLIFQLQLIKDRGIKMTKRKDKHYEVLQGRLSFNRGTLKVSAGDVVILGQDDIDNGYDIDSLVMTGMIKEIRKPRKKKTDKEN